MPRPRRKWTHYPSTFIKLLEHFKTSQETVTITLPRSQLYVYRTQFYRFMNAIREEHDSTDDRIAAAATGLIDAFNISNNLIIRTDNEKLALVFEWGVLADQFKETTPEQFQEAARALKVVPAVPQSKPELPSYEALFGKDAGTGK